MDFGLICSPWLHCEGIKYHLEQQEKLYPRDKPFITELSDLFYMDDLAFGAAREKEALNKFRLVTKIFNAGHFPLKKLSTNSKSLGEFIENNTSNDTKVVFEDEKHKFLGVKWNLQTDSIGVHLDNAIQTLEHSSPSKRSLLKGLAQVFDPIGILSPISIRAKMLLQTLWQKERDWDDTLTGSELDEFKTILHVLHAHVDTSIERSVNLNNNKTATRNELHVFCDASLNAYGSVIYMRQVATNGQTSVKFIFAKARVAPLKQAWTIPRLELLGAVIAAKITSKITEYIGAKFIDSVSYWCDNSAVLGWIRDSPQKWKAFVANRISDIHSLSDRNSWKYVNSKDNPADLLSRGLSLQTPEQRQFWFTGPKWLNTSGRPENIHKLNTEHAMTYAADVDRERKTLLTCTATQCTYTISSLIDESRFSTWSKAVRVMAFVLRFIDRCKKIKQIPPDQIISTNEFNRATKIFLHNIQARSFPHELYSKCLNIPKTSPIYQYQPFLDSDATNGLIRCRSRLEKSNEFSYDEKYPIILPDNNALVKMLVGWIHSVKGLHSGGLNAILHQIRSNFLVIHTRRVARSALSDCKTCVKFRAQPACEQIPPLPSFHIERSPPFFFTGVDFAGPIYTRNDKGEKCKSYIVLFCCAAVRAIHTELVSDLSTYEFLLALRRFLNRRPMVSKIISDNALSFKRAATELKFIYKHIKNPQTQSLLNKKNITWEFITERAPQHGAWWERLVQVVKRPLRKILGTNCLPFRELATILTDIEVMVNTRPLTTAAADASEIRALSPADLLYRYRATTALPSTHKPSFNFPETSAILFSKR